MKIILSVLIIVLLTSCFKGEKIDLIIHNGNIHIMNDQMDLVERVSIHIGLNKKLTGNKKMYIPACTMRMVML